MDINYGARELGELAARLFNGNLSYAEFEAVPFDAKWFRRVVWLAATRSAERAKRLAERYTMEHARAEGLHKTLVEIIRRHPRRA